MALVSLNKLAGKTQRVKLLHDQKIRGVALSKGDTVDLSESESVFLKAIDRVEFIGSDEPKSATR
jgi:hypothetical protein